MFLNPVDFTTNNPYLFFNSNTINHPPISTAYPARRVTGGPWLRISLQVVGEIRVTGEKNIKSGVFESHVVVVMWDFSVTRKAQA